MKINVRLETKELAAIYKVISEIEGSLTLETFTQKLLEDVAMAVTKSGSWQGSNMTKVLVGHGWKKE